MRKSIKRLKWTHTPQAWAYSQQHCLSLQFWIVVRQWKFTLGPVRMERRAPLSWRLCKITAFRGYTALLSQGDCRVICAPGMNHSNVKSLDITGTLLQYYGKTSSIYKRLGQRSRTCCLWCLRVVRFSYVTKNVQVPAKTCHSKVYILCR